MATLSCKRFGKGPNGTDIRLETADAEENDCLKQARLQCQAQVYNCISDAFGRLKQKKYGCATDAKGPGCLTDISCYNESCIPMFERCFCTGLCAMNCIVCKPDDTDDTGGGDDSTENRDDSKLKDVPTSSCWGCPIPITFGVVMVTGNIIWAGNVGVADVEIREVVGNVTNITTTQYGFMDFALALGEGTIEAISRVWINDQLVINNSITLGDSDETSFNRLYYDLGLNVELIQGTDEQHVHQRMQMREAFGKVPAYRGLSYLMFSNFPVFVSTSSMPSIKVEVITEIDNGTPIYETISIGDAIPDYLDVDDMNKRAIVSNGIILKAVDLDTGEVVNTYDGDTPILPTARLSPEGNMLFQTDAGIMTFQRGFDKTEESRLDVPEYDFARSIRIHDELNQEVLHVIPAVKGRDITLYKMRGAL